MARAIVTEEVVAEVAQQLAELGEEPSIIRIQALIGGGSFSTVKKHLDAWKAQRQTTVPAVAPAEILQRATEFGRLVWQEAVTLAAQEVMRVREEARCQVEEARAATVEAEQVIAQLELQVEEQAQQLAVAQRERDDARAALGQAQVAAQVAEARREEQAQRLADLQRQVEVQARLAGEVEALRHQLGARASIASPGGETGAG